MDAWPEQVSDNHARHDRASYKRVEACRAYVRYVAGPFDWRVSAGDTSQAVEYELGAVRPASELTDEELTWSRCMRVTADQVAPWFGLVPNLIRHRAASMAERTSMRTQSRIFLCWLVGLNIVPLVLYFSGATPSIFIGMLALALPPFFVTNE
jgi:hypothetical protein